MPYNTSYKKSAELRDRDARHSLEISGDKREEYSRFINYATIANLSLLLEVLQDMVNSTAEDTLFSDIRGPIHSKKKD
ncbi:hypothetical protein RCL_jg22721.t1 [Rhizophagus clarus]|uniref:Uncharacterized protein n=1 Tax=Rhizophagus clarus TaxID=94130 RepID=A0A8H3LX90_9GLOM|nr:hypothetical protein RCL_jg22721.t1 [Rhizophagus clarus]